MTIEKANEIASKTIDPYSCRVWEKGSLVRVYITIPYTFLKNGFPQGKSFNVYIENDKIFSQNLSKSLYPELKSYMQSVGIEDMPIV